MAARKQPPPVPQPPKRHCAGITKAGGRCQATPCRSSDFCVRHGGSPDTTDALHARTREAKDLFLLAYSHAASVTEGCELSGVGRSTVYEWKADDPEFAEAWHLAEHEVNDRIRREIFARGVEGWQEPVYQGGALVGHVLKKSDRMLELVAKSRMPEEFRERIDARHSGAVDNPSLRLIAEALIADASALAEAEALLDRLPVTVG